MKKIKLDIEYPKRELEPGKDREGKEIKNEKEQVSMLVIHSALQKKYQEGMAFDKMKMYSKILDKIIDENGKPMKGEFELSDEQFDFLYETLTTSQLPPSFATAITYFVEYLETIKLQK